MSLSGGHFKKISRHQVPLIDKLLFLIFKETCKWLTETKELKQKLKFYS